MSIYQNSNFMQDNQFELVIPSFEKVRFHCHSFAIPGISLPSASADTPFSTMALSGDKASFEPLQIEFIIDERMENFFEIYNWIKIIGYTDSHEGYVNYKGKQTAPLGEQDISVNVMNSKNNKIAEFTFFNAVPVSISSLPMTAQGNDVSYARANVVFAYDTYDLVKVDRPI